MKKVSNFLDFKKQVEKGSIPSLYLFVGEEEFNKREAVNLLIQKLIQPGLENFNLDYVEVGQTEISEIIILASTFSV